MIVVLSRWPASLIFPLRAPRIRPASVKKKEQALKEAKGKR